MENKMELMNHSRLDQAGAFLSFACAIHCLALPLLLGILPLMGMTFLLSWRWEALFICAAMFLATLSFSWGYRLHRKVELLLMLYLSTGMIVAGKLLVGGKTGLWLAVPGTLGLTAGHLLNRKLCKHCEVCDDQHHLGE